MTRILVAAVSAALLIGAVVSPAGAGHDSGGSHGGGFHEGFHGERFHNHDHDHFRGHVIVGGLAFGLGLGAVGGALLPPSGSYGPPAEYEASPVCYPPPSAYPPPPVGYCYGPDDLLYAL
jgi:hypothetical protein